MSADAFLQNLTDALFVLIFLIVAVRTGARPRRANVDTLLLFGAIALIVLESWVMEIGHLKANAIVTDIIVALLMALPYLLLRLVDDFTGVPRRVMISALVGLVASVVITIIWAQPQLPLLVTLLLVAYFAIVSIYVAVTVVRAARYSGGITRRRMWAVGFGSLCLGLVLVVAGAETAFPHAPSWIWRSLSDILALACGVSYFVGFVPPLGLRRAWQEPELRAFLGRAASLPRLPSTDEIVRELEYGAGSSLGTGQAAIGLWSESTGELEFDLSGNNSHPALPDTIARRAFATQRPAFTGDAVREDPDHAAAYRTHRVNSVLAVPITAGDKRLGVLSVYAVRAPIFAEDDLTLVQLLADQAAVILESRALIDEAARVQAREEATRLKDDFLSAAAHDLKTPLTGLIAQAQLLEHRAKRNPQAPADVRGIERLIEQSQRMRYLVTELLDVGRVEQGKLVDHREEVDLAALILETCAEPRSPFHPCSVEVNESVIGNYDVVRIRQLIDNLLDNAVKYSPDGGKIRVRVWREGTSAHITVTDEGIGIPPADLPHLFDRFHRGTNVDDRRFSGMGLGLYICRGIAEQHGGQLLASSLGPGQGSTFHVVLPATKSEATTAEETLQRPAAEQAPVAGEPA